MSDTVNDEFDPVPPTTARVAARAMVLAAVSCRGIIEKDAGKSGAEELRQRIFPWLERIGVASELEPDEFKLISTPLGQLNRKKATNASWRSEGMVVLAWALHCAKRPTVHLQCDPSDIANEMGFLDDREKTPVLSPFLRDAIEIEKWADTYLTLHWRLRLITSDPGPKDFLSCVAGVAWGTLRLDELELMNRDIAIEGVPIDQLDFSTYRTMLSIVQERHQAFNWLLGLESVYSAVTTDT